MSEMKLLDAVKRLLTERQEHAAAIVEIDRELADVRSALGLTAPVDDAESCESSQVGRPFDELRPCERCGASFVPSVGSAGRFCSRECYAGGISIDDRRALILECLNTGPRFAATLTNGRLLHVSRGTIHNDLAYLKRQGLVENTDEGWRLVARQQSAEGAPPSPLDLTTPTNYQSLPQSRSH